MNESLEFVFEVFDAYKCENVWLSACVVFEELVSKTSQIHSYMLLLCSSGHSKEANFYHKIYRKWKMSILIEIWNRTYQQIQILHCRQFFGPVIKYIHT